MILSLEDVSYRYETEPILDHVNFVVNEKEKWGVVGLNGAGKSTLLKIMAEAEKPDSGTVTVLKKYRVSYCPQSMQFEPGKSVYETVSSALKEPAEVYQIRSVLNQFGITDQEQKIEVLSGGQQKRVALAIALIRKADLYLLDEPTNHLDQSMILWLERYLSHISGALVMVTHDRYFLSRITNHMVEIDRGHLYTYDGNYADYLEQRQIRRQQALAEDQKRRNFLRHEIEWIRAGAPARSTKQKSRIERYQKIASQEEFQEAGVLELKSAVSRLGRNTISAEHISKAYGDKVLFRDFSFNLDRMDRVGIIGPNGCGKSTLLKILMGQVQPDTGTVSIGETVKIGYFAQQNEVFKEDQRIIDYLEESGKVVMTADREEITAGQMLERFLFPKDKQYLPISKCSGGEKRRLYLCSVLMKAPNILILDEPTNDLDTDTMTILEDYLEDFRGAVLEVSHDRYFLDRTADRLFVFRNGEIRVVQQAYSDFLEQEEKVEKQKEAPVQKKPEKPVAKMSYKEKKELQDLEKKLPEMEEEIRKLEASMEGITDYEKIQSLSEELDRKRNEKEAAENRWLELSEKAE